MIRLDTTTTKLQAVLGGAVATTQPQAIVCYSDDDGTTYVGGKQLTALNNTTDVDILAVPGVSTIRDVDYLSIYNRDTASVTVTVKYDVSGVDSIIIVITLATLETLQYIHGQGWSCLDAQGRLKTSTTAISGTLEVPNGGTGQTTLTDGGLLVGNGTNAITQLGVATNGQIPIGSTGADPVLATITGTANRVTVTNGAGSITLSGPQDLATSSNPTFAGAILTSLLDISGASAGQIKFPATQNASSNANTLDDYEEGTFTPGMSFGGGTTGITYSTQVGVYTKIGNMVHVSGRVVLTSNGSSTGACLITGMPFTHSSTSGLLTALASRWNLLTGISGDVQMVVTNAGTTCVVGYLGTGTNIDLDDTTVTDSGSVAFGGVYPV